MLYIEHSLDQRKYINNYLTSGARCPSPSALCVKMESFEENLDRATRQVSSVLLGNYCKDLQTRNNPECFFFLQILSNTPPLSTLQNPSLSRCVCHLSQLQKHKEFKLSYNASWEVCYMLIMCLSNLNFMRRLNSMR